MFKFKVTNVFNYFKRQANKNIGMQILEKTDTFKQLIVDTNPNLVKYTANYVKTKLRIIL